METKVARLVDQDFPPHSKLLALWKCCEIDQEVRPPQNGIHFAKDEFRPARTVAGIESNRHFSKISCLPCIPKDDISSEDMVKL